MTLTELKAQMVSALQGRSDLSVSISDAISNSIGFYQKKRFAFNQVRDDISTVAGQEFYSSPDIPSDIAEIDSISIEVNGRKVMLDEKSYDWMEKTITSSTQSQPYSWAWYANQIRLYPIPDSAYTLTISYLQVIDEPADGDSNAWTTDAAMLIKHAALEGVFRDRLLNVTMSQVHSAIKDREYARLRKESAQLVSGDIQPDYV